jgi:hypothetical protein
MARENLPFLQTLFLSDLSIKWEKQKKARREVAGLRVGDSVRQVRTRIGLRIRR